MLQGEIRIKGQTRHGLLADDPALAEQLKLGMVFQNGALFDSLSVGENVGFMLYEHTRMSPPRVEVRATSRKLCDSLLLPHAQGAAPGQCALACSRSRRGFQGMLMLNKVQWGLGEPQVVDVARAQH